jgi:hypothetical protein
MKKTIERNIQQSFNLINIPKDYTLHTIPRKKTAREFFTKNFSFSIFLDAR